MRQINPEAAGQQIRRQFGLRLIMCVCFSVWCFRQGKLLRGRLCHYDGGVQLHRAAELRATVPLLVISLQQREVKTELVNFFKCIKYQ